jgi:hypothetical protein
MDKVTNSYLAEIKRLRKTINSVYELQEQRENELDEIMKSRLGDRYSEYKRKFGPMKETEAVLSKIANLEDSGSSDDTDKILAEIDGYLGEISKRLTKK